MFWHRHKLTNSSFATATKYLITAMRFIVITYLPSIILVFWYVTALLILPVHPLIVNLLC